MPTASAILSVVLLCPVLAAAEEIKSGNPVGELIGGAFHVKGITGSGAGQTYCQVCRYGPSPVAILFVTKVDDNVIALAKAIDAQTKKFEHKGFRAFVCGFGGLEPEDLKKIEVNMPLTISLERDGPGRYRLNPEAAVTVIIYGENKKVAANFAFAAGKELTREKIAQIAAACEKSF